MQPTQICRAIALKGAYAIRALKESERFVPNVKISPETPVYTYNGTASGFAAAVEYAYRNGRLPATSNNVLRHLEESGGHFRVDAAHGVAIERFDKYTVFFRNDKITSKEDEGTGGKENVIVFSSTVFMKAACYQEIDQNIEKFLL